MSKYEGFDLIAWLDEIGIPYWTTGRNVSKGWVGISCPFCLDDKSNHGGINLTSKAFKCWVCGKKASLPEVIKEVEGFGKWPDVYDVIERHMDRRFRYLLRNDGNEKDRPSKIEFPLGTSDKWPAEQLGYLRKRGYVPEHLIEKYKLKAGPTFGDYSYRIIIPVYFGRSVITFTSKDYTGLQQEPYKHQAKDQAVIPAKECLYNLDNIKDRTAILVEGVFDVWRLGDGAICGFGTSITDSQLLMLQKYVDRLFVMFDGEPKATHQAYQVAYKASGLIKYVEVLELEAGDPDNLKQEQVIDLRRQLFRT